MKKTLNVAFSSAVVLVLTLGVSSQALAGPTDPPQSQLSAESAALGNPWGTASWDVVDGVLHIGPGDLPETAWGTAPWSSQAATIVAAVFDDPEATRFGTSTAWLFGEMPNLVSISGIGDVDTTRVTNMFSMFQGSSSLASLDLSGWDTRNVSQMASMFRDASSLTDLTVGSWDTAHVANMSDMFHGAESLETLDVASWNTSNVSDMTTMFDGAFALSTLDVSAWDTGNVTAMGQMFYRASSLKKLDVSTWNTANVRSFTSMFGSASSLATLDVSAWDTGSAVDMQGMFNGARSLAVLDVGGWNTANLVSAQRLFASTTELTTLNVADWKTGNLRYATAMFSGAAGLTALDVSAWDTSRLQHASQMFQGTTAIQTLDVSSWEVKNVTEMYHMFSSMFSLTALDLSSWDTRNTTDMYQALSGPLLEILTLGEHTLLSAETGLHTPSEDGTKTGKWVSVGTGSIEIPFGPWLGDAQELSLHSAEGNGDTYIPQRYVRVEFDPNGGTDATEPLDGATGVPVVLPKSTFTRDQYRFIGWNSELDGSGTSHKAGSEHYLAAGTTTLFAQWESTATVDPTNPPGPTDTHSGKKPTDSIATTGALSAPIGWAISAALCAVGLLLLRQSRRAEPTKQ